MIIYCYISKINGRMVGFGEVPGWTSDPNIEVIPFHESILISLLGENWREQYTRLRLVDGELVVIEESETDEGVEE